MRATSFREVRALLDGLGDAPALAGPWSYTEVAEYERLHAMHVADHLGA